MMYLASKNKENDCRHTVQNKTAQARGKIQIGCKNKGVINSKPKDKPRAPLWDEVGLIQ